MNNQQKLFIDFYLQHFNAKRAAIEAKYSPKSAHQMGYYLLRNYEVQKEIARRLADVHMSAEEALNRLADIARGDVGDLMTATKNGYSINLSEAQKAGLTKLIKRVKQKTTSAGTHTEEIELYSALDALEQILRVHGKFKDSLNLGGSVEMIIKKIGIDTEKL